MALYNCDDLPAGEAQDDCWERVADGVGTGAYLENVSPGMKTILKALFFVLIGFVVTIGFVSAILFFVRKASATGANALNKM
jgi:hypothetical protein